MKPSRPRTDNSVEVRWAFLAWRTPCEASVLPILSIASFRQMGMGVGQTGSGRESVLVGFKDVSWIDDSCCIRLASLQSGNSAAMPGLLLEFERSKCHPMALCRSLRLSTTLADRIQLVGNFTDCFSMKERKRSGGDISALSKTAPFGSSTKSLAFTMWAGVFSPIPSCLVECLLRFALSSFLVLSAALFYSLYL